MRRLMGLLLALNFGVLLAGLALQHWSAQTSAPALFNADKIRQLDSPMRVLAPKVAPVKSEILAESSPQTRQQTPQQAEATATASPQVEAAAQTVAASRCLQWSSLELSTFQTVERYLSQSGFGIADYELTTEKSLGWWVFLPPLENQAAVRAKIDEITRLGITDFALVRSGSMRNALSLGAFARLSQTRQHVATLNRKGVKGMQYGPRPEAGRMRLLLPASLAQSRLEKLMAAWPREVRPAPCS